MPVELLLLLLAWAATVSLIVVLPWAVVRLVVRVLERDVSEPGADHEHAQPHQPSDVAAVTELSPDADEAVESVDGVSPTAAADADAEGFHPGDGR